MRRRYLRLLLRLFERLPPCTVGQLRGGDGAGAEEAARGVAAMERLQQEVAGSAAALEERDEHGLAALRRLSAAELCDRCNAGLLLSAHCLVPWAHCLVPWAHCLVLTKPNQVQR